MVKHIDNELKALNDSLEQMWTLVFRQISKSRQALFDCNRSLAREIIAREKMCNALELKIDSQCENFIALNNPVAIDLRLVLAVLKINNNLERIGDFAESVATFVLKDMNGKIDSVLATNLRLEQMFDCIENGTIPREKAAAVNRHLAMNHSIIEDTCVFGAIGISVFWIISTRMLFALIVVWGRKLMMKIFRKTRKTTAN